MSVSVSVNRDQFMDSWFHMLPQELQEIIIKYSYRVPKPLFKKGSIVTYTANYKKGLYKRINELKHRQSNSSHPTGRLRIYQNPSFNWYRFEWSYAYEYGFGGLSEGYAMESDLEIVPLNQERWL